MNRAFLKGATIFSLNISVKVDDYLRKSSLTGPETFMVVFSHEKEEDSVKK